MSKDNGSKFDWYSFNGMGLQTFFHFKTFLETYKFIQKSQWWSSEQILEYQTKTMKKLINHAYKNVPYYKNLFIKNGLKPDNIKTLEDMQKIPYLTKEIVLDNINDMKAINYPKYKFELNWTGGSSGYPLKFYSEKGIWISRLSSYSKLMIEWGDCNYLDKSVTFDGYKESIKHQIFGRVLALSSFYMDENNLPLYIDSIRKMKPKYFIAYPSAVVVLANFMNKNNIKNFECLKSIFCFGETLYDWHRDLLEKTFKCKIFVQYGHREQATLASSCSKSDYYHFFPQYGFIELIDNQGRRISSENKVGEIVATGFHSFIFPFIRYKTKDIGVFTKKKCECGRNFTLLKRIEGRSQDFLISKTNRILPLIRVHHIMGEASDNVKESQLYQDTEGEVELRIVKTDKYSKNDTFNIKNKFENVLGNDFNLNICFVDKLKRTDRGKLLFLIQKLNIDLP